MKTRERLELVEVLMETSLNEQLIAASLKPMDFCVGPMKTEESPKGSIFMTGGKKADDKWLAELWILLRLPGSEEKNIYDYGDVLSGVINENHRINGAFEEALVEELFYYDTTETKNPMVLINITTKVDLEDWNV